MARDSEPDGNNPTHATAWNACRLLPAPERAETPETVEIDGDTLHLVPDTGYTMLIAWQAGTDNLARMPDHGQHTVRITTTDHSGTRTETEPRTQRDQDIIDDAIDEYLADASVPAPPRGYRWYQRLPHPYRTRDSFDQAIHTALTEHDPHGNLTRPRDLAPLTADIITALYN